MRLDTTPLRFSGQGTFHIRDAKTQISKPYEDEAHYLKLLEGLRSEINELQKKMFAHDRYAVLAVFQAMDAAGKDSTITHVFTGVNPTSVEVHPFVAPSIDELDHDFLWRGAVKLPRRGHIGVFNRSYYEEVLICKVHPEIILNRQRLPEYCTEDMKKLYKRRYEAIRHFEEHLHNNGTRLVKFFLHVSKREQAKRFLARIDDPSKNWKFEEADISEREHWDDYMEAYEKAINETATEDAPWYVIPADDKRTMRLLVAQALLTEMNELKLKWPKLPKEQRAALERSRAKLAAELD